MRILKRWAMLLSIVFVLIPFGVPVLAAGSEAVVSGENVTFDSEKIVSVPVNIKNNPGIMGFKISVEFSDSVLALDSIDQGTVTQAGRFSTKKDSEHKTTVLWNNTSQISNDGSLFILNFVVLDNSKNGTISFSYSEEDTFNEDYKNVPIIFEEINLIAPTGDEPSETKPTTDAPSNTDKTGQDAEANTPTDSIAEPTTQKTEQDIIIDSAVEEIKKNFSDNEISSIVEDALKNVDSPSISEIPEDKKEAFAEDVREQLAINGVEKLNELNDEELISALEKVIDNDSKEKLIDTDSNKNMIISVDPSASGDTVLHISYVKDDTINTALAYLLLRDEV